MSTRHRDESDRGLLLEVARLHYEGGLTKVEISEQLGISRFRVARLLDRAREIGVVTITVQDSGELDLDLSRRLSEALGLEKCIVVRSAGEIRETRDQVGAAAADHLTTHVQEDDVVGFTWGRTVGRVAARIDKLPRTTIIQLTGYVSGERGASPVERLRRTAESVGGTVLPIFSPMIVPEAQTAKSLARHSAIRSAVKLFDSVTTAVLSVGSWDPVDSQVREVLADGDIERLSGRGTVADVAGIMLRADGALADPDFQARCIAISAAQLRKVPHVALVAAGAGKAVAVRAALKAGIGTMVVTDSQLADELLRLEGKNAPQK